jgi:SAM-dependent methyltransferase
MASSFSFRDPDGFLMESEDSLLRVVRGEKAAHVMRFLEMPAARRLMESDRLVKTSRTGDEYERGILEGISFASAHYEQGSSIVLEHERIHFPSYPFEWPAEMLHEAAILTLDLAEFFLEDSFSLKDATPYNILFRGPEAVFVDVLSFEERDPLDPIWRPYGQFMRNFMLPLLTDRKFGLPPNRTLSGKRDGLTPEELYRLTNPARRLFPPFLGLVSVPVWLAGSKKAHDVKSYEPKRVGDESKARFILSSHFAHLRRRLVRLEPRRDRPSFWAGYEEDNSYNDEDTAAKESFVSETFISRGTQRVLDIGCNTGRYSRAAALTGASVVAVDTDPVVVGRLWRKAREEGLDILPLVIDFADPTPSTGWQNKERRSFLDRCAGSFDAVMMLAVLHHLLAVGQIPLDTILDVVAGMTGNLLVIEYVPPEDPMFRRLMRGRDGLYSWLTEELFERTCIRNFEISASLGFKGNGRRIYAMRKRVPNA